MNMSYCRFHNTVLALRDCHAAIMEMIEGEAGEPLSREELRAAKDLAEESAKFLETLAVFAVNDCEDIFAGKAGNPMEAFRDCVQMIQDEFEANEDDMDEEVNPFEAYIGEE